AMRGQQALLARTGEQSIELRAALSRLRQPAPSWADREAPAAHQHPLEVQLARLVEESTRSRASVSEELRALVERMAQRSTDEEREALLAHKRAMESHLARLVDENVRG